MTASLALQMEHMGQRAKSAARTLAAASPAAKTLALRTLAELLRERQPGMLKANALDVEAAKAANMDAPRLDRLTSEILFHISPDFSRLQDVPDDNSLQQEKQL